MRNAFLVSDDDLKSLRNGEPWSIELQGQAVFLHESVLKLLMHAQRQTEHPTSTIIHTNGPLDSQGRPLTCDQPDCPRNLAESAFPTYMARQTHRSLKHSIPGDYAEKHRKYPKKHLPPSARQLPSPSTTPIPLRPDIANLVRNHNPDSYRYMEFDAKGVCGVGDCDYKDKHIKTLHFHRSVKHGVRGINWHRKSHKKARRKVGRPRKVA